MLKILLTLFISFSSFGESLGERNLHHRLNNYKDQLSFERRLLLDNSENFLWVELTSSPALMGLFSDVYDAGTNNSFGTSEKTNAIKTLLEAQDKKEFYEQSYFQVRGPLPFLKLGRFRALPSFGLVQKRSALIGIEKIENDVETKIFLQRSRTLSMDAKVKHKKHLFNLGLGYEYYQNRGSSFNSTQMGQRETLFSSQDFTQTDNYVLLNFQYVLSLPLFSIDFQVNELSQSIGKKVLPPREAPLTSIMFKQTYLKGYLFMEPFIAFQYRSKDPLDNANLGVRLQYFSFHSVLSYSPFLAQGSLGYQLKREQGEPWFQFRYRLSKVLKTEGFSSPLAHQLGLNIPFP